VGIAERSQSVAEAPAGAAWHSCSVTGPTRRLDRRVAAVEVWMRRDPRLHGAAWARVVSRALDRCASVGESDLGGEAFEFRSRQQADHRLSERNGLRSGHGYSSVPVEAPRLQSNQRPWLASTPCFSLHHGAIRTRMRRLEGPAVCRRPAAGPAEGRV